MMAGSIAEPRHGLGPFASQGMSVTEANALPSLSEKRFAHHEEYFSNPARSALSDNKVGSFGADHAKTCRQSPTPILHALLSLRNLTPKPLSRPQKIGVCGGTVHSTRKGHGGVHQSACP